MIGALAVMVVSMSMAVAGAGPAAAKPSPPGPIPDGQLGGTGPCIAGPQLHQSNTTPGGSGQDVWVFTPTGTGSPRTGGTCSDAHRPVAFVVHGFLGKLPATYQGLIDNLVSDGHIVVFANYSIVFDPDVTYYNENAAMVQAAGPMNSQLGNRMDLSRIGIWGHSLGAGMVPWLAQQADSRGWGSSSMWLSMHGMFFAFFVGTSGPIHLPANARVQIVHYDDDQDVDGGIGIDAFTSFDIPAAQKTYIEVHSDEGFDAGHLTPISQFIVPIPADHLDRYGVWRNTAALAECAQTGNNCAVDLGYQGTWSDGHAAPRADVYHQNPVDVGPPARSECEKFEQAAQYGVPHLCTR